jgi:hypothetical protein
MPCESNFIPGKLSGSTHFSHTFNNFSDIFLP